MREADAIVIGAGVMGTATARALARDREVVLFEQFRIGHKHGSSHGASRIFRYSYPNALYVEMAMEALGLWRDLESESGRSILYTTGGLDRGQEITDNATALETCGASYELMDGVEASRRFDTFALPPDEPVLYQPDGGITLADDAVRAFADTAIARGARLLEGIKVDGLERSDHGVTVTAGEERWHAPLAVVAAGGWARPLLGQVGISLPTVETRETVAFFSFDHELFPTLVEWGASSVYSLPSPGDGIKVGEHIAGPPTDADDEGSPDADSVARLSSWVADRFPKADPTPRRSETCIYTNTDDQRFILERHGPIVLGSACSGHGFKFAPLIGKRLAELATS